jgi:BirA family biotin operon repressor/biotin-[acetyl-CoA-carboxylase] ligase
LEIIKLNAIASTNSFLKDLSQNAIVKNLTTIVAHEQTNGRGQLKSNWISEPYKNLTFSTFIEFENLKISHKKYLNFAISLAIYNVLITKKTPKLSIKWPNDILSANKKICGILVENTFFGGRIKNTIIGIGLNVNQEIFPDILKNVTSLKIETSLETNLDTLLNEILLEFKKQLKLLEAKEFDVLNDNYLNVLYKKNIPTMFKNSRDEIFMGMISGISDFGKLQILLEDDSILEFGVKEVSFL